MAPAEQAPIAAPAFAVVRRGYDPDQVARHLDRVHAETTILAADRAAAVEQAGQLSQQLASCRRELDAARTVVERLRGELRVLSGPPDTTDSMSERLQVMLRLAKDEFTGMRAEASAEAAAHVAEIIAAVGADPGNPAGFGFDESELRGPRDEEELERMRREAAAERARLDEEAAARRAAAEEEFRRVLALRCREAMAQLAKVQLEALRSARRVMDDADEQARTVLSDAREVVRRTVDDAQREVDVLQELRLHLAAQLDTSRQMLDQAIPEARAAAEAAAAAASAATAAARGHVGSMNESDPKPPDRAPAQQPPGGASTVAPPIQPAHAPSTSNPSPAAPASTGQHRAEHAVAHQLPVPTPSVPAPSVPTPAEPNAQPSPGAAVAGHSSAGQQRGEHTVAPQLSPPTADPQNAPPRRYP